MKTLWYAAVTGFTLSAVTAFGVSAQSASPLQPSIQLSKPQVGPAAKNKYGFYIVKPTLFSGEIVYGWDTGPLFFSGAGNEPPWQSFLTLHSLSHSSSAVPLVNKSCTFSADIPKYLFLYGPQFSPDRSKVLFKIGDNVVSTWGTYQPFILNLRTNAIQEIPVPTQSVGALSTQWSSDSRYLAYLQGGFGEAFGGYRTAELHVYDTQKGIDQSVVRNNGVINSFAWTTQDRLLYSTFAPVETSTQAPADLYQFFAITGTNKLLRHDAYRPFPSPDGNSIVLLSTQDPQASNTKGLKTKPLSHINYQYATNKYLILWSLQENKNHLIRQENHLGFSEIRWLEDSHNLVLVSRQTQNQKMDQAEIARYFLANQQLQPAALVSYPDINHIDEVNPLFVPLNVSHDGQWLFFKLIQPYEAVTSGSGQYLRAIHLSDGRVVTLCFNPGHGDLDWRQQ